MMVHIIYQNYLSPDGNIVSVGGIQTYITNLLGLFADMGQSVNVYQVGESDFTVKKETCTVMGFCTKAKTSYERGKFLYKKASAFIDNDKDLLLFGCETMAVPNHCKRSIAIQHGIFWDKPNRLNCSRLIFMLDYVLQCYRSWKTIKRIKTVNTLVCVDYNFVNWYRALVAHPEIELHVIPNFSDVPQLPNKSQSADHISVIFARRFFDYRGTRIFADAMTKILDEYDSVDVTIAGDGPDEDFLKNAFSKYEQQVRFIRYSSKESLMIHSKMDIAVVPTLGSEGTSLSLLEAMASKCAVICTNVGGMTNIVLDGFNGLMVSPDAGALYNAMKRLVTSMELRSKLSQNAYITVKNSFSYDKWKEHWMEIIIKNLK